MRYRAAALFVMLTAVSVVPARSQNAPGWDPGAPNATRAELEELLRRLEETSRSQTYTAPIRELAAAQVQQVKKRLEEGDMQFNEAVRIDVKGAPHEALSNTYGVSAERKIVVPNVGEIPLAGVLRSELHQHLTAAFAKSLRGFELTVRVPIRLEIAGAVVKPGPAYVPPELPLMEVVNSANVAGGVKPEGVIEDLRVLRAGKVVLDGKEWQIARAGNHTIEQLGLRSGDVVQVPTKTSGLLAGSRRFLGAFSGIFSIVMLVQRLGLL